MTRFPEPAEIGFAGRFADRFAQTNVKGTLTRAAVAWVLITPAVVASKIWWSTPAAIVVAVVSVTVYVVVALRVRRDHRQTSAT